MALQDILKRILDEASTEVKAIETRIKDEKKKLAEESAQIEKAEKEALDAKTERVLEAVEQKMTSMARRDNAKTLLATKQKLIALALEKFLKSLEEANEKTYGQILEKLFEGVSASSGKVFAPAKRLEITSRFAPPGFDVVAHKDIDGGFILKIGNAEIDNSFRTLLFSEYRDQLTSYFAEQLKLV